MKCTKTFKTHMQSDCFSSLNLDCFAALSFPSPSSLLCMAYGSQEPIFLLPPRVEKTYIF